MDRYLGSVMTVNIVQHYPDDPKTYYRMVEDHGDWLWHPDMIAGLIMPVKTVTQEITFDVSDPKASYKKIHQKFDSLVQRYQQRRQQCYSWSEQEIETAKKLCIQWAGEVVEQGNGVYWVTKNFNSTGEIICRIMSVPYTVNCQKSRPHGSVQPNLWVGKCVSLAKALGKPIPDFIQNKNFSK